MLVFIQVRYNTCNVDFQCMFDTEIINTLSTNKKTKVGKIISNKTQTKAMVEWGREFRLTTFSDSVNLPC